MAHKSSDSLPMPYEGRTSRRASSISAVPDDEAFVVGFYSLDQHDPEEATLRAALENAGDFSWRHLECRPASGQGLLPSEAEVCSLRLGAVIVVLCAANLAVVGPLFGRLRLNDPHRPILVALRGLSTDGISEVLAHGASDFLLPPFRAEDLVPRLRRFLHRAPRRNQSFARIQAGVGVRNIVGQSPALLREVKKLPRIAACDAPRPHPGRIGYGQGSVCSRRPLP